MRIPAALFVVGYCAAGWAALTADPESPRFFIAPTLELAGGYRGNRYSDTNAQGVALFNAATSVQADWLGPRNLNMSLNVSYEITEFAEHGFGQIGQGAVDWQIWKTGTELEAGYSLAGGAYRDSGIPTDDLKWIEWRPAVYYAPASARWIWSLAGLLGAGWYDSAVTQDGDGKRSQYYQLGPGVQWLPSARISGWLEAYYNQYESNNDDSVYRGPGVRGGVDLDAGRSGWGGVWVGWERDYYKAEDPLTLQHETDRPLSLGAWWNWRIASWLEFFGAADWTAQNSNVDSEDYEDWNVRAGFRGVREFEPLRRARK